MDHNYKVDKERQVGYGLAWEKYKSYLQETNKDINIESVLEKRNLKRNPIVSCGIIEFVIRKNVENKLCVYYHVFKRRNTTEYDTIIKGFANKNKLFDLISLLSSDERKRILENEWEELWNDYWIDEKSGTSSGVKSQSKRRFPEYKNIISQVDEYLPYRIHTRPYIFPKGKPDKNEKSFDAALREAREETKSSFSTGHLYFSSPIIQNYTGSDGSPYVDYYYVWKQSKIYSSPIQQLSNVSISSPPILRYRDDNMEEHRNLKVEESIKLMVSKAFPDSSSAIEPDIKFSERRSISRLRTQTISHELESDAWIEIPIFHTTAEFSEWSNNVNPFQEFQIFKRHFSAILTIHRHLCQNIDEIID